MRVDVYDFENFTIYSSPKDNLDLENINANA